MPKQVDILYRKLVESKFCNKVVGNLLQCESSRNLQQNLWRLNGTNFFVANRSASTSWSFLFTYIAGSFCFASFLGSTSAALSRLLYIPPELTDVPSGEERELLSRTATSNRAYASVFPRLYLSRFIFSSLAHARSVSRHCSVFSLLLSIALIRFPD